MKRLIPHWPFPPYIFLPGSNPHPKKQDGHMEGEHDPVASRFFDAASSDMLRYAIDLYNFGYYWESHVYFEALWNAYGRVGSEADFFKAMIKLGAAGLKVNLKQMKNAQDHFLRAIELLESVKASEGDHFLGFSLSKIILSIESFSKDNRPFSLFPDWE